MPLDTAERRANEQEVVEKTTTQMYRAPEMVDLYMERELTEKVDVWVRVHWGREKGGFHNGGMLRRGDFVGLVPKRGGGYYPV